MESSRLGETERTMALIADVDQMSDEELGRAAFSKLAEQLGPGGFARFLRLYCSGKGNYTEDRRAWLDGVTLDEPRQKLS